MKILTSNRPMSITLAAMFAIIFGALTVTSGGMVLFSGGEARAGAGNIVPFVLWFNFLAGFAYIVAGAGLLLWRGWAVRLAALIALATVLVFVALIVHIIGGGAYETRTVAAMTLRSAVWLVIAFIAHRAWKNQQAV